MQDIIREDIHCEIEMLCRNLAPVYGELFVGCSVKDPADTFDIGISLVKVAERCL